MPSSESEDFESADEGQSHFEKDRKKRLSSSNYSDDALESTLPKEKHVIVQSGNPKVSDQAKTSDGWDDFDIDNAIDDDEETKVTKNENKDKPPVQTSTEKPVNSQDTGWEEFDDWGNDQQDQSLHKKKSSNNPVPDPDIRAVTEKLAETTTKSSNWGWGWGVDSLLSTATAGITTLTSQVSQGISTVLESGIGAPDPEELARRNIKENEKVEQTSKEPHTSSSEAEEKEQSSTPGEISFPFGSILSGVTKFVETTGTKVITGGLDTLETIGKKTMEVLQDGDPGLVKKRAMLGLSSGDKPVLSQILREAKAKADEEDKVREEKREAKEVHYENLFDDFEGLVHLEALEMLSKQVSLRIEERMRGLDPEKKQDVKETLQQVAELCEIPEDEDDDEESTEDQSKPDTLHERLQTAVQDLGLKLQFQPLIKQYTEVLDWLNTSDNLNEKAIYKRAVSGLAQATALAVEVYHKTAEMLLVKPRRSTADEADALTQMTVVLTKHVSELATLFTAKLNSVDNDNKELINDYTTYIFLESGNSSTYIQNAFQLALPILQIGAV